MFPRAQTHVLPLQSSSLFSLLPWQWGWQCGGYQALHSACGRPPVQDHQICAVCLSLISEKGKTMSVFHNFLTKYHQQNINYTYLSISLCAVNKSLVTVQSSPWDNVFYPQKGQSQLSEVLYIMYVHCCRDSTNLVYTCIVRTHTPRIRLQWLHWNDSKEGGRRGNWMAPIFLTWWISFLLIWCPTCTLYIGGTCTELVMYVC